MNFSIFNIYKVFLFLTVVNIQNTFAVFNRRVQFHGPNDPEIQALDARFKTPQGQVLVSRFDDHRRDVRILREWTFARYNMEKVFQLNTRLGKVQQKVSASTQFPCDLNNTRSLTPPTSVHKLRPGDIDIIASIGDSMSAGTCLMGENPFSFLYENRGLAFSGGCYGSWRQFLTLPNILKVFNPKLYGCAIIDSISYQTASRLNVAEPIGMSRDMLFQAKNLFRRMRKDPNVDLRNHWKVLTIFLGNVDFCADYCVYDDVNVPLGYHEQHLRQTLTFLRDNVPRLFVNLVPAANMMNSFEKMKFSNACYLIHHTFCFCVNSLNRTKADREEFVRKVHLWQELDEHIANLPEFNTDDFTVAFHPAIKDPDMPHLSNGETDQRYFAMDCFHLSQLGHASLANALWNSMMQPVGRKIYDLLPPFEHFECPNAERPFLATNKNSFT